MQTQSSLVIKCYWQALKNTPNPAKSETVHTTGCFLADSRFKGLLTSMRRTEGITEKIHRNLLAELMSDVPPESRSSIIKCATTARPHCSLGIDHRWGCKWGPIKAGLVLGGSHGTLESNIQST